MNTPRPKQHLEYYSRVYPSAWRMIDSFRAGRGKELPFWPEWCFCPLAGAYAIVTTEAESQGIDIAGAEGLALINDVGVIGALAAWRVTQGIYRFDPDVYRAVIDTPIAGDLPHNILCNLPEWCVYIETPGLKFLNQPQSGFFAYLECDANDGRKELRLALDHLMTEGEAPKLTSQVIHLGPWSLLEAVERAMKEAIRVSKDKFGSDASFSATEITKYMQDSYAPMVSLLLYICSVNGEIRSGERRPSRPLPTKTKKGQRMFPPPKVTTWDVGVRMGAALRMTSVSPEDKENADTDAASKQRSSPRPHVRRAHWHGYWSGPRDGERKYTLHWIPPVLVSGDGSVELPVTIKPVK